MGVPIGRDRFSLCAGICRECEGVKVSGECVCKVCVWGECSSESENGRTITIILL